MKISELENVLSGMKIKYGDIDVRVHTTFDGGYEIEGNIRVVEHSSYKISGVVRYNPETNTKEYVEEEKECIKIKN